MSVTNYTVEQLSPGGITVTWSGLHNGDTGLPLVLQGYAYVYQVLTGTQGTNGEVTLQRSVSSTTPVWGSNSPISVVPTNTSGGNNLVPGAVRPNVTNGDGTTNLTFTLALVPVQATI